MVGLKSSRLLTLSINVAEESITKIKESSFKMEKSIREYLSCSPNQNCLNAFSICDTLSDICIVVIPPIQLMIVKDHHVLTKYFNPNLNITDVLKTRLFKIEKKLVIVHTPNAEIQTVKISVFRFGRSMMSNLLIENHVKLSKESHFKSIFELISNDRTSLGISPNIS